MRTKHGSSRPARWVMMIACSLLVLIAGPVGPIKAQADEGEAYHIQRNDTLWKLAEKYLGEGNLFPLIVEATAAKAAGDPTFQPITTPDLLYPGQTVWIPPAPTSLAARPALPTQSEVAALPVSPVSSASPTTGGLAGHIAFSFWNNAPNRCTYEINIIDVDACLQGAEACQANRRIYSLNNISEPALSSDGQRLAFRGWGPIPEELAEGQPHPYHGCAEPQAEHWLQTGTVDATDIRDITQFFEDSHPDWSPDDTRILFDSGRNGDGITRILFAYADRSIDREHRDDLPAGEEELRIAGQQPSWAPDNERFVFRGCDPTGNRCGLWLARAIPVQSWDAGKNLIGPLLEEPEASQPDWSPVADEIVYQSPTSGSWDLYIINSDGTGKRQVTTDLGLEGLPAWSPDGQWIAYVSHDSANWSLRAVNRDGTGDRQLFAYDGGIYAVPKAIYPYGSRDWLDEQISWSR